jgi:glucose-6-phosphate dehydrogenase assembly protein OpcA
MATAVSIFSPGLQVEIGKIDKELKKLWAQNEGATRASLINLAVYSEEPGSLAKNTELMSQLTENHSCRAIVIGADPRAETDRVEAWISAHCHVTRAGSKQICSEQLSFLLEGPCTGLLPNIVFAQLDSDLPFYLWWQGELHDPLDPQLWAWVDRFIYDSQNWKDFRAQLQLVETAQREAKQRIVLCDLNWTRLDKTRLAIAQFFDHPASHHHFGKIKSGRIDFAPGYRSTAMLLAGWLAAQLNWRAEQNSEADGLRFAAPGADNIDVALRESGEHPIGEVLLETSAAEFLVRHASCGDLLEVSRGSAGAARAVQLMPAQTNGAVELMSQELLRGGPHQVYLRAVNAVRELL